MTKTRATWKVLDYGTVGKGSHLVEYDCPRCGHVALLPVHGLPLAQSQYGIFFDIGKHDIPKSIQCRHCRRSFEKE